jgi:hypothetical protein
MISRDFNHSNAARKHSKPLLQFLAIVVGSGVLDLLPDLGDARLDVSLFSGTIHNGGVILGDHHALGPTEHVDGNVSSLMPRSSEIISPPVSTAMFWSMALRRSLKPGPLTAATFKPPRSFGVSR